MTTTNLTLKEIYNLAIKTLKFNGCDELNSEAVAETVTNAERDGSVSHGLFRIWQHKDNINGSHIYKSMPLFT